MQGATATGTGRSRLLRQLERAGIVLCANLNGRHAVLIVAGAWFTLPRGVHRLQAHPAAALHLPHGCVHQHISSNSASNTQTVGHMRHSDAWVSVTSMPIASSLVRLA